jgi:hypothetical protein
MRVRRNSSIDQRPALPPTELPLVSVVIPAFNAERFLRLSLDSIVGQTYPNREILLMDDASTDSTGEIAQSYGDAIIYYRQPRNRGQFPNVDDGIARASGKYIAVYHADDIYHPEILSREVAFLETYPQAGAVFALDIFIDAAGRERGRLKLPRGIRGSGLLNYETVLNTLLCFKNCIFPAPSSMVRADVYRAVGRYRGSEFPVAADFEMFFRIARQYPVGILPEYLFRYRWGHGNADQMERLLRTSTEPFFAIMDQHLSTGGRELARSESLKAYNAHRAEDALMRAVSAYILRDRANMLNALADASYLRVLASGRVQRYRLTVLHLLLDCLAKLAPSPIFEAAFRKRWFGHVEPVTFESVMLSRTPAKSS